jgi:2-C-methyl-D-erythritol 4-phosphate cytidylyltransferase/2-C-methyl-D-erythritol 2,4-cyclodiphosphate synthase
MTDCIALVVACGRGRRFGGEVPKQYLDLAGEPVLRRAVSAFLAHPRIGAVRAIIHPDDSDTYERAVAGLSLLPPVFGGKSRQDSVRAGLESLADSPPSTVLVHDGVRPLVSAALIDRVLDALDGTDKQTGKELGGAIAALPVRDTLKREADGRTAGTVDRAGLWRAQTPQAFPFEALLEAHRQAAGSALTDDAAVAEQAGMAVALVPGDEDNLKITTEADLKQARRILFEPALIRVGQGFDAHRFVAGDHVWLCGVRIEHEKGLAGHSDADVGLHAATDAILGALGDADIGAHFPDSDPKWKGVSSDRFLAHAARLTRERGGEIVNLDITLICEAPRIARYRAAMIERISGILGIPAGRISVKASTSEGMGFTGRGEGIAGQAIVALRLPA